MAWPPGSGVTRPEVSQVAATARLSRSTTGVSCYDAPGGKSPLRRHPPETEAIRLLKHPIQQIKGARIACTTSSARSILLPTTGSRAQRAAKRRLITSFSRPRSSAGPRPASQCLGRLPIELRMLWYSMPASLSWPTSSSNTALSMLRIVSYERGLSGNEFSQYCSMKRPVSGTNRTCSSTFSSARRTGCSVPAAVLCG